MKFTQVLALSFCALSVGACAGPAVKLDEKAKKIAVRSEPTKEQMMALEKLKRFTCEEGGNGRPGASNVESCRNELRNQAALIGAEFIVIEKEAEGASSFYGKACNNCYTASAWAYKKKAPQKAVAKEQDEELDQDVAEVDEKDEAPLASEEFKKDPKATAVDIDDEVGLPMSAGLLFAPSAPSANAKGPSANSANREPSSSKAKKPTKKKPRTKKTKTPPREEALSAPKKAK